MKSTTKIFHSGKQKESNPGVTGPLCHYNDKPASFTGLIFQYVF